MEAVFVPCWEPGGLQMSLVGPAVVALLAYTVGYPVTTAVLLYRNRMAMREDQLLRAHGTGTSRLGNPRAYDVRKRYHKLYYQFKPAYFWYTLAIVGRKFLIAFTALMFRKNPSFQLAVALLVVFASYVLQVRCAPPETPSPPPSIASSPHSHPDRCGTGPT